MNRKLLLTLAMLAVVLCVALATPHPPTHHKDGPKPGHKPKPSQHSVGIKAAAKKQVKSKKDGEPIHKPKVENEKGHHHVHFRYHTHGKNPQAGQQAGQVLINKIVHDSESVVHVIGRAAGGLNHGDIHLVILLSLNFTINEAHHKENVDKHIHENSDVVWYHTVTSAPFKIGGKGEKGDKNFSHMSFIKQIQHYAEKGLEDHDPKAKTHYKLQAYILHERGQRDPKGLNEITVAEIFVDVFDSKHDAAKEARQHTEDFHKKNPSFVPSFDAHPEIDTILKENNKLHAREYHAGAADFLASDLDSDTEAPSVGSNEVNELLFHDASDPVPEASDPAHAAEQGPGDE